MEMAKARPSNMAVKRLQSRMTRMKAVVLRRSESSAACGVGVEDGMPVGHGVVVVVIVAVVDSITHSTTVGVTIFVTVSVIAVAAKYAVSIRWEVMLSSAMVLPVAVRTHG